MTKNLKINSPQVLFVEPFYGGSHKNFIDTLTSTLEENGHQFTLVTLTAKKWHWRARCGALVLYDKIPDISTETVLFCSSVLNLCELLGLRSDLHRLKKIVYFHENQLVYPIQEIKSRDVQYAYNQIMTCLAADYVVFNSKFNMMSFLDNIKKIVKLLPDNRPKSIREKIENKSRIIYFPVNFPKEVINKRESVLHIVWPHRWEFDKCPEDFINVLLKLKANSFKFKVSLLGEMYSEVPDIFNKGKEKLDDEIAHFGYLESKNEYFEVLSSSHVVVSTAKHEFFGVSVMEAVYCGCYPILPNKLVYPELYPKECLYSSLDELFEMLKGFCLEPSLATEYRSNIDLDFSKYSNKNLLPQYMDLLDCR